MAKEIKSFGSWSYNKVRLERWDEVETREKDGIKVRVKTGESWALNILDKRVFEFVDTDEATGFQQAYDAYLEAIGQDEALDDVIEEAASV